MAVIFVVTAVVQWPAAVILLLASMLLPLNLRLAGLFAKEGADSPDGGQRQARRGRPRQFRGMPTLRNIGRWDDAVPNWPVPPTT